MKAIEFTTTISDGNIKVPSRMRKEIKSNDGKKTRVILLIDESDTYDEREFRSFVAEEFLKGYSASDCIYDNY